LFNLVLTAPRTGIGHDCDVRLIGNVEFFQHRAAILTVVPNGNETEFHFGICLNNVAPAVAVEFSLTIGAPRRPKMHDGKVR
jgi:hypothetical protein